MTEIVKREIDELRDYVNLKDCQKTMNKACDKKYYELVTYIANHRENYEKYIKENYEREQLSGTRISRI